MTGGAYLVVDTLVVKDFGYFATMEKRVQSRLRSIVPWNRPGSWRLAGCERFLEKRSAYRPGFPRNRPFPSS